MSCGFRAAMLSLTASGVDASKAAAALLPLLTGADVPATFAAARDALALSPTHMRAAMDAFTGTLRESAPQDGAAGRATAAAAALPSTPESQDATTSASWLSEFAMELSEGLRMDKLQAVERECAEVQDYSRLLDLVRNCFSNAECMRRSFQVPSCVPTMDLSSATPAVDTAPSSATEKRARLVADPSAASLPPQPVLQHGRSAGGLTPSGSSTDQSARAASRLLTAALPARVSSCVSTPDAAARPDVVSRMSALDGDAMSLEMPAVAATPSPAPPPPTAPLDACAATAAGDGDSATHDTQEAPPAPARAAPAAAAVRATPAGARVLAEEFSTPALTAAASARVGGAGLTPSSPYMGLPPCPVDLPAVVSAFTLLASVSATVPAVGEALAKAQATLASYLLSNAPRATEVSFLTPVFIMSCNPQLEDPSHHEGIVAKLCRAYTKLRKPLQQALGHWFATVGGGHELLFRADDPMAHVLHDSSAAASSMTAPTSGAATSSRIAHADAPNAEALPAVALKRAVDWTQQFITVRLYQGNATVENIAPPVGFLSMLNAANEEYFIIHGRRALPFQSFYNDVVVEDISLKEDYKRWLTERRGAAARANGTAMFSFCSHPFILDAAAKSTILGLDAQMQMAEMYRSALLSSMLGRAEDVPFLKLQIRRESLLEDALRGIVSIENKTALKRPLKVAFEGEEGLDEGGVRKEFFSLMVRQLFTPDFGMVVEEADTKALWFNSDSLEANIQFELVGSLIGLAIYNSVILDVNFPLVVYRKLKRETVTLRDLEDFRPQIARTMRMLLEYAGDDFEDVFGLNFTVTYESWGTNKTQELVPGGADKPVTLANRKAYVHAYLRWVLVDSIAPQFEAFARGFHNVAGGPALDLFRAEELQLLVVGSQELDFHALERVAEYEAPYSAAHATIKHFWEVVHELSAEQKRKFLKFSTGSDRAPIRGLGNMRFIVDRAGPDSDRLVSASTCFQFVHLPEYATKEKLEAKLKLSIEHCEGFGVI